MDAIVAHPYGLGREIKDRDQDEARKLEKMLFPILCSTLNQHHNTRHSERFWCILLGHWFRRYIDTVFNRVKTLELCLNRYEIAGTSVYSNEVYSLATPNSYSAIWATNNDRWNNSLCACILNMLAGNRFPVEVIQDDDCESYYCFFVAETPKTKLLRQARLAVERFSGFITGAHDAFIFNSYLPKSTEILLQLAMGQMPTIWHSRKGCITKQPDDTLRDSLSDLSADTKSNGVYGILSSLLFKLLPVCYLEGFADLKCQVESLPWPRSPQVIYTCNAFDTDELFKMWTACKVEEGVRYVVGQHGNNYGTHRYMNPTIEEATSDKFLTWGWTDGMRQHTAGFIITNAGKSPAARDPDGGLLLMEITAPFRFTNWDGPAEFGIYLENQMKFVDALSVQARKNLTIRLQSCHPQFTACENERWRDYDRTIEVEDGTMPIDKMFSHNRLVVYSYDSTGLLECLSQNTPTIAFWHNGLDHLRDTAIPYYQMLVETGIVHFTAESAAEMVNRVWNNVDEWWSNEKIQQARKSFCNRYAHLSKTPIRDLKKLLLN